MGIIISLNASETRTMLDVVCILHKNRVDEIVREIKNREKQRESAKQDGQEP